MLFDEAERTLRGIPYIIPANARRLFDFIRTEKPKQCLELGFAHGTSSCYIAAALAENGEGHLTTVDLNSSKAMEPSIEELLRRTGLEQYVTVARETNSYTWFLKKALEAHREPCYDFCFIDGAKNWTVDGCAFFLVDRLLKKGGWVLFDDLSWTYGEHSRNTGKDVSDGIVVRSLGSDELEQPHVRLVFELLVMTHPDYSEFRIEDDNWAWAHKISAGRRVLTLDTNTTVRGRLVSAARRLVRRYRSKRLR